MIKKVYIKGTTWNPRLLVQTISDGGTKTPKDMTGYTCQFAMKRTPTATTYLFPPVTGTPDANGHLDFELAANTTAQISAGTFVGEIHWWRTDIGVEDRHRYQFEVVVLDRVIDGAVVPVTETDTQIANFAGPVGVTITHAGDGTEVYFPIVIPIGEGDGNIGEVSHTIVSDTEFIIHNTGSSTAQFRWRILK